MQANHWGVNLHEISNDNSASVVNFAMFKRYNVPTSIHIFAWAYSDGETCGKIGHILIEGIQVYLLHHYLGQ